MQLKSVAQHYDDVKPANWCSHDLRDHEGRTQTGRVVQSVRDEIADALREALNSAETSLPQLIEDVRELAQAAKQKPAEVAVETDAERRGRREFELFWAKTKSIDWSSAFQEERERWITYAATINRPKVSPGQRLLEAIRRVYGAAIPWDTTSKKAELEAAAEELGIKECDA